MEWGFGHMQRGDGGSIYLRLSTREIEQAVREDDDWQADAIKGGYWLKRPGPETTAALVFTGAIAPEMFRAWEMLAEDVDGLGLLNVTSPDLLHRDWSARQASRWQGEAVATSHVEALLGALPSASGLVTAIDGSPGALSWLGGVKGQRVSALGTDRFGQTGDLVDLYREYRLDADAIVEAAAELFLG